MGLLNRLRTLRAPRVVPLSDELDLVDGQVGKFVFWRNDVRVAHELKHTGIWSPRDVEIFRRIVTPQMLVVDLGASIGHHTVLFSCLVGSAGIVVALEPQRRMFWALNANLALNSCFNAHALQYAAGARSAEVFMSGMDYNKPSNYSAVPLALESGQTRSYNLGEAVTMAPVDDLLQRFRGGGRKVGFMKIDVQASELFALQGADDILRRDQPTLFIEISPYWMRELGGYDYREIYTLLESRGYSVTDPYTGGPARVASPADERDMEWDVLAVPR
jgi:FkbM family methyltransferase